MAQLWSESFQWTTNSDILASRYYQSDGFYFSATAGRNGGAAARTGRTTAFASPGSNVVFFHVRMTAINVESVIYFSDGYTGNDDYAQAQILMTSDGRLQLLRGLGAGAGSTVIAQTAAGYVNMNGALNSIAGKLTIHGSAGTCDVWLNGTAVAALSGLTGLDLTYTTSNTWNNFTFGGSGAPNWRCDLFVWDDANPTGNDLHDIQPDVRVDYAPADGNGYSSQFVGQDSNSTDNYLNVDDTTPDNDTTYNQSTSAAIDGYTFGDAPAGYTMLGVTSLMRARKVDAGVASLKIGLRSGTTNSMSAANALSTSYQMYCKQHGVNPNGNIAWTEAAVNAAQVVVERT